MLKVPPSSKSNWLQIARPRLGKLILRRLALIAFIVLAWLLIGVSVFKPAIKPLAKMDSGCVISSMSFKIGLTAVTSWSVKPIVLWMGSIKQL